MVQRIPVVDEDLKEPGAYAPRKAESSGKVLRGISLFVGAYALLHRLLIPLFLKFTVLKLSANARIDLVSPLIFLWWWWWFKKNRLGIYGSFLMTSLMTLGVVESYQIFFSSDRVGWLAISHLLSIWPVALCSLAVITRPSATLRWQGAGLGIFFAAIFSLFVHNRNLVDSTFIAQPQQKRVAPADVAFPDCGAQKFILRKLTDSASNQVWLENCGLRPASVSLVRNNFLVLRNNSSRAMQLHFYVKTPQGFSQGWNVLVKGRSEVKSPPIHMQPNEVGVLFSDAHTSVGLSAILWPESFSEKTSWSFMRDPLRVEAYREL